MYQEREPCTAVDVVVFALASGMACGATHGAMLEGTFGGGVGGIIGTLVGALVAWPLWLGMNRGTMGAGCVGLPAAILVSVLCGIWEQPLIAVVSAPTALLLGCTLAARQWQAARPIDMSRCETCGYDLRNLAAAACPECGRERVVVPVKRKGVATESPEATSD